MIDTQTNTNKYIVYKHTSPSGKVYIGITKKSPKSRWNNGKGYASQQLFYRAIKKYGWDKFKHEILFENLTHDEACKKEIELIRFYKSQKLSYNQTDGGEGFLGFSKPGWNKGIPCSEEMKKHLSKLAKERGISQEQRKKMIDAERAREYKHTQEIRDKISKARKGMKFSEEHIRHIHESGTCFKKGQTPWNKGITTPQETREKIGNNNSKTKKVIDTETGKIYFSLKDLIRKEHLLDGYHKLRYQIKTGKCIRYKYVDR